MQILIRVETVEIPNSVKVVVTLAACLALAACGLPLALGLDFDYGNQRRRQVKFRGRQRSSKFFSNGQTGTL